MPHDSSTQHFHSDTESECGGSDSDDDPSPPPRPSVFASQQVHTGSFQGALALQQGTKADGHLHRTLTGSTRGDDVDWLKELSLKPREDGSTDLAMTDRKHITGHGGLFQADEDLGPAPTPSSELASRGPVTTPTTREQLAKILEGMEFGKKITKLEVTLRISIQITRTVVKMSRNVAPHNSPAPVLVIHCTRLPDHKGIVATPELRRWEPVDLQPHKQQYIYIVSETKKITINVTFKLIKAEEK